MTPLKKKCNPPTALVDMDGTVYNFHDTMNRDLKSLLGKTRVSKNVRWKIGELIRRQDGWFRELKPLPLGFKIVSLLRHLGYDIMVLTKGNTRVKNCWSEKAEWCSNHMPFAKVTITEDKGLVYGRVLVDDWPAYIERWKKWRPRGIVIVPAQPWNRHMKGDGIYRVRHAADLAKLKPILAAQARRVP